MSDPTRAEIEVEVRYAETDQMGVVHHANYLVWFELARTRLCSLSGYHYSDIEKLGYLLMVTGAELNYRRSARYGDTVLVSSWIDRLGSRGLNFAYEVVFDGQVLVTGKTRHVWVEVAKNRPCCIPEPLREPFGRLASRSAE
jgi:acyl-CoA thioester hydrolase